MNRKMYFLGLLPGLFSLWLGCSRPFLLPEKEQGAPAAVLPFDAGNNAYFPGADFRPPLKLKKILRPISAPMPDLAVWGEVLLVPTKNGRLESYHLKTFRRLARKKMPEASHARVLPYRGDLLVALEFGKNSLLRLDGTTKKILWRLPLHGIAAFPKISGDTVFVAVLRKSVVALDWNSGKEFWRCSLKAQVHATPVLLQGLLIVADDSGQITAVVRRTGKIRWRYSAGAPVVADPVVFREKIAVATTAGEVILLNSSGRPLWQRKMGAQIYRSPAACPEGLVIAVQDGTVHLMDWRDGKDRWRRALDAIIGTRPMVSRRHVILGTLNKTVLFLNRETGEPVWELEVRGRVRTDFLPWKNLLIFGSEDNYVYLFAEQ